jgi:AraC-like DNA-binding protein
MRSGVMMSGDGAMIGKVRGAVGAGLERSCGARRSDWLRSRDLADGVQLLEAWFAGHGFDRHRHDTYGIGLTDVGVQAFDYRGVAEISIPGQVVVLHPDETHDGRAGTAEGFGYRIVYVAPALIREAARAICGHPAPLPFAREAVTANAALAATIEGAFRLSPEPLAVDGLVLGLAGALLDADRSSRGATPLLRVDARALDRARQFLDAETARVIRSFELEAVTGLGRYELARQFRTAFGTSPYRYSLMRRLERARTLLHSSRSLADTALAAGFADQSHLTRMFKSTFGVTPARYCALTGFSPAGHR